MPVEFDATYERADFETLYRREHWHTWDEEVHWLLTKGMSDSDIGPGEAMHMAADIQRLRNDGIRFTDDPQRAYQLARAHCNHFRAQAA
jgi:hypothetical protein